MGRAGKKLKLGRSKALLKNTGRAIGAAMLVGLWLSSAHAVDAPVRNRPPGFHHYEGTDVRRLMDELLSNPDTGAGPTIETLRWVPARLIELAGQSLEARAEVIAKLVPMLDEPEVNNIRGQEPEVLVSLIRHRWLTAVRVLGRLKAEEAVDPLVRQILERGTGPLLLSLSFRPVAVALIEIGEPAAPRLVQALSDIDIGTRDEAAGTLAGIGEPALPYIYNALFGDDPAKKVGAAMAIGLIQQREGYAVIRRAISVERDEQIKSELENVRKKFEYLGEG